VIRFPPGATPLSGDCGNQANPNGKTFLQFQRGFAMAKFCSGGNGNWANSSSTSLLAILSSLVMEMEIVAVCGDQANSNSFLLFLSSLVMEMEIVAVCGDQANPNSASLLAVLSSHVRGMERVVPAACGDQANPNSFWLFLSSLVMVMEMVICLACGD
jgi:hypothetical protein